MFETDLITFKKIKKKFSDVNAFSQHLSYALYVLLLIINDFCDGSVSMLCGEVIRFDESILVGDWKLLNDVLVCKTDSFCSIGLLESKVDPSGCLRPMLAVVFTLCDDCV